MAWSCPACGRTFGRTGQPHSCAPAADLGTWLQGRAPEVGPIVAAIQAHLGRVGDDVRVEATRDALMLKRARTFAEVKPRRDRTEVSFVLSRRVDDPRVVRTLDMTRTRIVHVLELHRAVEVDEQLRGWLTEAYESSPL